MPENYNVQLFVGFGGSGGKTLARFAELATQNNEWAKKAAKEIYFLLCDTDQSELEESHAAITKSFKNINPKPVIKVLQLGDGIPSMESHIAQVFRDTDSDGIDRLSKHWWVNDEGIPFKASALAMPPANGAGQCPAVAHFLAWNKSPELKSLINDIIQEILTRTATGGGAPNVAVTFVASLAGGTGRGCWPLLALMLREELRQRKHHCFPQGYFFDQSCFQQVMAANPGQTSQLMVNSLTGLSELIAWIRNDSPDVQNPIEYTLPHMRNPQESSQDVIDIQLDNFSADAKGKSPLNHAWMIFRESKSGALAKTEDYYHMVASCLYTQAATGIASREANDRMAFGSAGAAVCRIKIREIREYLKNKTISQLCKNLQSPDSGDSIDMQSKWDFTDFAESFGRENNDSGTIIEKINYYVNDGISPKRLIDAMKKQDVKKALRFASQLDTPDDELIQEACFKAFKITNTKDTATTSGDLIKRAMLLRVQSDVLEKCMYLEAGSVKRICEGLQNKMMESAKALGQIANANTRSTKIHDSVDDVKGRALKDGLKPFSDAEIEEVKRSIPNNYIDACRSKVAELLSDACNATAAKLNMMTDNVELALSELAAAAIIYDDEVAEVEPGLFTIRKDGKWSVDDEHARDIFDETRFTERILRPALDEDESSQEEDLVHIDQIVEAIISQESVDNHFSELKNNLLGAKLLQSEITDVDRADFRRKLRTGLEELYDKISVEENVLVRNFSFATVIKGLRKAWSQRMLGVPEGPERDQLANRFEAEFGLKLETEADGSLVVPTLESMLVHLTISIAKTCDAYFRLVDEGGQDTLDRPAVTLPENEHVFTDNLISRMKDPALLRSANILPE
ncbi:hypothetical protein H8D29_07280, partial [PVC group bacterium]|nr:hypothetical protein [PVC group bacterium]